MKKLIALFVFSVIGSFVIASLSSAAGSMLAEGDILKIEGEFYSVHDTAGREVRLHVNKTTHREGTFLVGDKVEVYATDKGHARAMYRLKEFTPVP